MNPIECEVLIAGGGPTGVTLAVLLAQQGVSVLVAEKEAAIYPLPRAAHLDHETMRILQAAGVADAVAATSRTTDRYDFLTANGQVLLRFEGTARTGPGGWPGANMIHQPSVEAALRGRLAELPGARLESRWELTAFSEDSAGITAQFRLNQKFSMQTSLGVERKGALSNGFVSDTLGNTIGDYKNHVQFDYIVLPVLLRYHFGKQQLFFVNAGPYLGYLFRQNNKVKSDLFQDYSYSDQAYFKQLDAGVTAGIGMNIPLNEELVLSVECRDNLGISNISKLPVVDGGKNQTNSINFLVGLHYQLGN